MNCVYDALLDSRDWKSISREDFNKLYFSLSKYSIHPVDIRMRQWLTSDEYYKALEIVESLQ